MNVLIYRNAESVWTGAAILIASHLLTDPKCVIGVDYHEMLVPVYRSLSVMTDRGLLNWDTAKVYQLFEFLPVGGIEQRIAKLLGKALFAKTGISEDQYTVPFSTELTPEETAKTFERSVLLDGGLDVALLAVRQDGSILMNRSADCDPAAHVENVDGDGFITAGTALLMQAKHPVVVAAGKAFAESVKAMLSGSLKDSPLAVLRLHPGATFIMDEEAAELL